MRSRKRAIKSDRSLNVQVEDTLIPKWSHAYIKVGQCGFHTLWYTTWKAGRRSCTVAGEEEAPPAHTKDSEIVWRGKIAVSRQNNVKLKSAVNFKSSLHQQESWPGQPASNCEALGHSKDEVTSSSLSSSVFLWWQMFSRSAILSGRAEKHHRAANGEETSHERLPRSGKQSDLCQKSGASCETP